MKTPSPLFFTFAAGALLVSSGSAAPIFSETFDGLPLGPRVTSQRVAGYDSAGGTFGDGVNDVTAVWTPTPPAGWQMTKAAGHGAGGDLEFSGWTFLDPRWWATTAGQNRANFTKGTGVIAVADSDEFDDRPNGRPFDATLTTPAIGISAQLPNSLVLRFDSSWRQEPQTGTVAVSYDGGAPIVILSYDGSTPTGYNDTLELPLNNPAGAGTMTISWHHTGTNNWWWAIDNIQVDIVDVLIVSQPVGGTVYAGSPYTIAGLTTAGGGTPTYQWYRGQGAGRTLIPGQTGRELHFAATATGDSDFYSVDVTAGDTTVTSEEVQLEVVPLTPTSIVFAENFDGIPLGYPVQEGLVTGSGPYIDGVWTATPPTGWSIDNVNVVGIGDPNNGVQEWEGWSFTDPDWWNGTAGDQGRSLFTRGGGAVAVVDPDEWDDIGNPDGGDQTEATNGAVINYNSRLLSPAINIAGRAADSLKLRFASSWLPEVPQQAILWVSYDGGPLQKLLHWNAVDGDVTPDDNGVFKGAAQNESVLIDLHNPQGAASMQLVFQMPQADNDWWWAIDNLIIFSGSAPADILAAPNSRTVLAGGGSVFFEAQPDGIGPFTYSWTGPAGPVTSDEATDPANRLTIANPGTADMGRYTVSIANAAGAVTSAARLSLLPFLFDQQPADQTGESSAIGGDTVFIDAVINSYDPNITYQWFKFVDDDSNPATPEVRQAIQGAGSTATNAALVQVSPIQNPETGIWQITLSLILDNATPSGTAGRYCVDIGNSYGTQTSRTATIDVSGVVIIDDLDPVIAEAGAPVTLSVLADSFETISYQWYKGTATAREPIAGQTSSSLNFPAVTAEDTGYYSVDVSVGGTTPATLTSRVVKLTVYVPAASRLLFAENFDGLTLGHSVDEGVVADQVWTGTAPVGWTLDDSGVPGSADPATDGVTEWAGWAFANTAWWINTAGDQGRSGFTKSTGAAMIADPDEWDDLAHTAGSYNAFVSTPAIPLQGAEPNSVVLTFDSSWQYEAPMGATLEVSFDQGATWRNLLRFSSDTASGDFKADNVNETISIPVFNPAGASTAMFRYGLINSGNNWFWAVDNIKLTGAVAGFAITSYQYDPVSGMVSLSWESKPLISYTIETSTDLQSWTPSFMAVPSGGTSTSYSFDMDLLFTQRPARFFIRIQQP